MSKDKYYVYQDDTWKHRSPIKLLLNPILRKIQFFTNKPYVIASDTGFDINGKPYFIKYKFMRVEYIKD